jgi:GT2 family glycosyltransferase
MDLSVIIVSFNTKELLRQCLDSIFKHTRGIDFEVIVVDNASEDGSREYLKTQNLKLKTTTQKLKPILNNLNLGFAKANNQGIKLSRGKYILLLNSDTELKENSLKKMVDWMEENQSVGISSCQLVYQDGRLQGTGGYFPNLLRIFNWMFFIDDLPVIKEIFQSFHPHEPKTSWLSSSYFQKKRFQDWVSGAFFLMRKKVIDQIGLLDEEFFMYVEEVEFCYRAKQASWQVAYVPITKITHFARKSGSQAHALLGEYRGVIKFYKKHQPFWQLPILRIILKAGAVLRLLIFGIIKGDRDKKEIYKQSLKLCF